jgi:ABC-type uncharacterized transport system substrate-binding protein
VAVVPSTEFYGKNLELLKEVLPPGTRIGVLFRAIDPVNALWLHATEEASRGLGMTLAPAGVSSAEDFEQAMTVMQHGNVRRFVVLGEPLFTNVVAAKQTTTTIPIAMAIEGDVDVSPGPLNLARPS